ncbi:MAG: hypothetical protein NT120_01015 [Candidatus Aenigmarchaeota archaeon]|nr:hypothetical protein [Candidatus Aenigmarchaeota archaeon]
MLHTKDVFYLIPIDESGGHNYSIDQVTGVVYKDEAAISDKELTGLPAPMLETIETLRNARDLGYDK